MSMSLSHVFSIQVTQVTQYTMIEFKLRIDQFKLHVRTNEVHVPMNFLTLLFIFVKVKSKNI